MKNNPVFTLFYPFSTKNSPFSTKIVYSLVYRLNELLRYRGYNGKSTLISYGKTANYGNRDISALLYIYPR